MKALLTGATSYIGHHLALKLASENFMVHALVRNPNSNNIPKHANIILFEGDICDYESVEKAIQGCEYVFHTAAFTNLKCNKIDDFFKCNVIGTQNILKASLYHSIKKVIYTSTLSVFGPSFKEVPITESQPRLSTYANDYELTKSMSEEVVLDYVKKGLFCVILNLTRVYGPGLNTFSNGVNRLVTMITNKDLLIVPSKLQVVSNYVFIEDVTDAHLLAIKYGKSGEKYIIGGENMNYNELFQKIKSISKSRIRILKVNYDFVKSGLFLISKLRWLVRIGPSLTPKILDSLFTNRSSSSEKAIAILKYKITPFDIGIRHTVNFLSK